MSKRKKGQPKEAAPKIGPPPMAYVIHKPIVVDRAYATQIARDLEILPAVRVEV